jgi:hypothetical protein
MVKPMKHRDVVKALRRNGCTMRQGRGDHEVWTCGCDLKHTDAIRDDTDVSPGVIRSLIDKMECLPKGWLQ